MNPCVQGHAQAAALALTIAARTRNALFHSFMLALFSLQSALTAHEVRECPVEGLPLASFPPFSAADACGPLLTSPGAARAP
jgi:hypothetical protein